MDGSNQQTLTTAPNAVFNFPAATNEFETNAAAGAGTAGAAAAGETPATTTIHSPAATTAASTEASAVATSTEAAADLAKVYLAALPQPAAWHLLSTVENSWKYDYLKVVRFKGQHGHVNIDFASDPLTAAWLQTQQGLYRVFCRQFEDPALQSRRVDTLQMQEMFAKCELLRVLGITLEHPGSNAAAKSPNDYIEGTSLFANNNTNDIFRKPASKRQAVWEEKLRAVKEFRDTHGHCDCTGSLSHWVGRQRKRLKGEGGKQAPLTEHERQRLEDVGIASLRRKAGQSAAATPAISAATSIPKNLQDPALFEEYFSQMQQFYEEHGHCIVPDRKYPKLRNWLVNVRNEYKRVKAGENSSVLTPQRMERLQAIEFSFEPRPKHTFEERFHQWLEYRKQHNGEDPVANRSGLGKWVTKTRMRYHNTIEGKQPERGTGPNLTEEQVDMLRRNGFTFGSRDHERVVKSWEERYEDLLKYKQEHGCCDVPQKTPGLGEWVHKQRTHYQNKKLKPERLEKLQAIGFTWLTRAQPTVRRKSSRGDDDDLDGRNSDSESDEDEMEEQRRLAQYNTSPMRTVYAVPRLPWQGGYQM